MRNILITLILLFGCEKAILEDIENEIDVIEPITTNEFIYVLMAGQSNCIGSWCNEAGSNVYSDSIQLWNGRNWFIPNELTEGKMVLNFAYFLSKKENKKVRILKVCQGGNEIEKWLPPINTNMIAIDNEVLNSKVPQIDIILWSQGEKNYNKAKNGICNNNSCYIEKLYHLIDILQSKSYASEKTYFISSALYDGLYGDRNSALQVLNENKNDRLATIEEGGLSVCDNVHFDVKSQELIGQRMYDEFLKIRNN